MAEGAVTILPKRQSIKGTQGTWISSLFLELFLELELMFDC